MKLLLTLVEAAFRFRGRGGGGVDSTPPHYMPDRASQFHFWVQEGPMGSQGYIGGILYCFRFIYWPLEACQIHLIHHRSSREGYIAKNQFFGSGAWTKGSSSILQIDLIKGELSCFLKFFLSCSMWSPEPENWTFEQVKMAGYQNEDPSWDPPNDFFRFFFHQNLI